MWVKLLIKFYYFYVFIKSILITIQNNLIEIPLSNLHNIHRQIHTQLTWIIIFMKKVIIF